MQINSFVQGLNLGWRIYIYIYCTVLYCMLKKLLFREKENRVSQKTIKIF